MVRFWQIIVKLLAAIGGFSIICVFFLKWGSELIADRLHLKWKNSYDKELEDIRSLLARKSELLSLAISTASEINIKGHDLRLKAINEIWESIIKLRNDFYNVILYFNLFSPEEYNKVLKNDDFKILIPSNNTYVTEILRDISNIELNRPFIEERLWILFYIYRAVIARLSYRVIEGKLKGVLPKWDRDENGNIDLTISLLKEVLKEEEIEYIQDKSLGGPQTALEIIEFKILEEMHRSITGISAAKRSLEDSKRYLKIINDARQTLPNNIIK